MAQIVIKTPHSFLVFDNKKEALEMIDREADFLKWGYEDLTRKQATIYEWLEWDYIFHPSKFTLEEVLCHINETRGWKLITNPDERKVILNLWKEHQDER